MNKRMRAKEAVSEDQPENEDRVLKATDVAVGALPATKERDDARERRISSPLVPVCDDLSFAVKQQVFKKKFVALRFSQKCLSRAQ